MKIVTTRKTAQIAIFLIFVIGAITILSTTFNPDGTRAQGTLNNGSIEGTYAAFSTAETRATLNGSVLSVAEFNGAGSWDSTILRNTAGNGNSRGLESLSSFGTYVLQANGLGNADARTQPNDGASNDASFDFVVTQTENSNGVLTVTEFYALPRLSSTGRAAGVTFKRLPDNIDYRNGDLRGTYAISLFVGDNESAGLGRAVIDGLGNVAGTLLLNEAKNGAVATRAACLFPCLIGDGDEEERLITTGPLSGGYVLEADGRGRMDLQTETSGGFLSLNNFDLLVTQAEPTGIVTELIALQREAEGTDGGLRSLVLTRISD